MYFLDTNTCIYFLTGRSESVKLRLLSTAPLEIKIPSVVKAELLLGAFKSQQRDRNLERLEAMLAPFEIVPFDDGAAYVYALMRKTTEEMGNIVGPNDLLIAATVQVHEGILVTSNIKEFSRVPELHLEDWREPNRA